MLEQLNNGTTMIGSLPHTSFDEAFRLIEKYPLTIPVWPQLPKRAFSETMVPQYSEGLPGITINMEEHKIHLERNDSLIDSMTQFYENFLANNINSFAISNDYASGFHHFLQELEKTKEVIPFIKGQVTGPFTFSLSISDSDGKSLWSDEQYRDIVIKGLQMKALWQINKLEPFAEKVLIFFDEPIFSALGTPGYLGIQDEDVINTIDSLALACQKENALTGIHCCGNMDWGLLTRTKIDIIAFDAYFYGEKVALYPKEITGFLKRGGILAWGIVPTNDSNILLKETPNSLKEAFNKLISHFIAKGIPEELLNKQLLFTPSCGIGPLSPSDAEVVLKLLKTMQNTLI